MAHKTESYKRYVCSFPSCPAAYNKQWKLDAHLCKHTGVKPFACDRRACGKSFTSSYHLARHDLTHRGEKPFQCAEDGCEETFTTNANRTRHVRNVHAQQHKRYLCKFEGCGLEFRKNKQLKSHVCEQHSQLPPYLCAYEGCQMRFAFPSRLNRHQKVHRGYPCTEEGCGFTGKTWTEYLKHRKERHARLLKCDRCEKVFRDAWFLQQHQRVHSEVRLVLHCPRDGCSRSFTTAFNLESHVSSFHEGLRPFACTRAGCGKSFSMKKSLQRHGVVHDPGRKRLAKSQPKRSIASKLSGYEGGKEAACRTQRRAGGLGVPVRADPPGPVELVSLLQDTSLLCGPAGETRGLADVLAAPLTM
ncbi:transcription factor IIIA-like [Brachionichthys hirsutus]|uniref:transcription factor IIIA-like n=1 Tax=Brachionichthys hirsutus TaxID=412623 RepID=UPI0036047B50